MVFLSRMVLNWSPGNKEILLMNIHQYYSENISFLKKECSTLTNSTVGQTRETGKRSFRNTAEDDAIREVENSEIQDSDNEPKEEYYRKFIIYTSLEYLT